MTASIGEDDQITPGLLLSRINNILCDDTPMNMFITCLLVILDLHSGEMWYANAGHNLPYHSTSAGIIELYATGVPLAIFPGVIYDDHKIRLMPGESLLMYSDGLVEAHDKNGDLFGTPRLNQVLSNQARSIVLKGNDLIQHLLSKLGDFTGPDWEQEDDVTMVVLDRG
jgi:serine phosphatase RsbU (regulator of sigma subunit)